MCLYANFREAIIKLTLIENLLELIDSDLLLKITWPSVLTGSQPAAKKALHGVWCLSVRVQATLATAATVKPSQLFSCRHSWGSGASYYNSLLPVADSLCQMKWSLHSGREGQSSASSRICAKLPRLVEMAKRTFRQSGNICTCVDNILYELSEVVRRFMIYGIIYLYCAVKK